MHRFSALSSFALRFIAAIVFISVSGWIVLSCSDDSSSPQDDYVNVQILQPSEGDTLGLGTTRIIADVTANCGCTRIVEFYLDSLLLEYDSQPVYSCDLYVNDTIAKGSHLIRVHGYVVGKAEGWDSMRVVIR